MHTSPTGSCFPPDSGATHCCKQSPLSALCLCTLLLQGVMQLHVKLLLGLYKCYPYSGFPWLPLAAVPLDSWGHGASCIIYARGFLPLPCAEPSKFSQLPSVPRRGSAFPQSSLQPCAKGPGHPVPAAPYTLQPARVLGTPVSCGPLGRGT